MRMARVRTGMRERARSLVDARLDERREPWMSVPQMMHNLHDTAEDGSSMTSSSTRNGAYLLSCALSYDPPLPYPLPSSIVHASAVWDS